MAKWITVALCLCNMHYTIHTFMNKSHASVDVKDQACSQHTDAHSFATRTHARSALYTLMHYTCDFIGIGTILKFKIESQICVYNTAPVIRTRCFVLSTQTCCSRWIQFAIYTYEMNWLPSSVIYAYEMVGGSMVESLCIKSHRYTRIFHIRRSDILLSSKRRRILIDLLISRCVWNGPVWRWRTAAMRDVCRPIYGTQIIRSPTARCKWLFSRELVTHFCLENI